ncbi:ABC-2 type transport system permease protein [Frondihabitans sp. PhB188]|uniref:ABC transporter permease n=1 Tax=Frondihabitans sp. PhB188 TaxID=2485200 RepID=UPI000FA01F38|nr:ABC transporter permease [Frondihabitans sp. PhB188]ROQ36639.1 ABC-2 type transport system permease protein [Frondihabitans sp. PhB188]
MTTITPRPPRVSEVTLSAAAQAASRYEKLKAEPMEVAGQPTGAFTGFFGTIRDVIAHGRLLDLLIRRDLKSRYKDSALGFLWTLIRPITQLAIYYVILGNILGAARGIDNFAVYVFCGLTVYNLFSDIVAGSTGSIVANAGLIKKVYVPREIYPLASVGSALFNFGIQLVVLLIATVVFGEFPAHLDLLYFFPSALLILIYGLALGLLLSAANVFLRDMGYLVEIVLMLLMWASPIVYAWSTVATRLTGSREWLLHIYTDNPITLAVLGFHRAFWLGGAENDYPADMLLKMGVAGVIGLVLVYVFHRVFSRLQGNFAQEL